MKCASRFVWLFIAMVILCPTSSELKAETTAGDLTGDGMVDMLDVITLIDWWMQDNCNELMHCFGVDNTGPAGEPDGIVNYYDFIAVASNWLIGIENPIEEPPFPL